MFGGMMSFRIKDDREAVNSFMQALRHIPFAPSLAGVTTSISHPARHLAPLPEAGAAADNGHYAGVIRLSVGIEEPEELIADLEQALAEDLIKLGT